jgi:hypothetical protein
MGFLQALTSEPFHTAKTPTILVFHFQWLGSMIQSVVSKAGRKSGIFHRAFLFQIFHITCETVEKGQNQIDFSSPE